MRTFVDTNVLVYAADASDRARMGKARTALLKLQSDSDGVISTQVMQEFYVVLTRKLGVPPLEARTATLDLTNFDVVSLTPDLVESAIDLCILNKLSFWDALILAAAREARCARLLSEDMHSGATIAGVRIENPFA